jgi:septum site-determining protein MinC
MEIKGDRRGLRCLAHGYDDATRLIEDLAQLLDQREPFLVDSRVAVEVSGLPLTTSLLSGIAGVFGTHPRLTLSGIFIDAPRRPAPVAALAAPAGALLVRSALRSGQIAEHAGDIVVLGDVKPGARVIAGGDVFVLGRLSGMALAGQPNVPDARIFASVFEPTQVRIADVLAVPAQEAGREPECASLEDGRIVVSPWGDAPAPLHHPVRRAAR